MKAEAISLTITNLSETVLLEDSTLTPVAFIGSVSKDGTDVKVSFGVSDGTRNKALASSYNTSKNTDIDGSNCLLAYENGVLKIKGDALTGTIVAGEANFTFETISTGWTLMGIILGN